MNRTPFYQNKLDYNEELNNLLDFDEKISLQIPFKFSGSRLDVALAKLLPEYSRTRLSSWIKNQNITVNKLPSKINYILIGGEEIEITPLASEECLVFKAEPMQLNIIYEDESVIIIDKPNNLVVHPASGNWTGTLLQGLLHHNPKLSQIPRAGIVHRLDKDTSGLMVIAKTLQAQNHLVKQLQNRTVKRIYRAIAVGIIPYDGTISTLIGRDPHNRTRMAVVPFGGKEAITHIKILEHFNNHTYIECSLETGRTHQIRVHLKEAKHPLIADPIYGHKGQKNSQLVKDAISELNRQALHAFRLSFIHPNSNEPVTFESKIPDDIYHVLSILRLEAGKESSLKIDDFHLSDINTEDDMDDDVEVIYMRDE